MNSFDHYKKMVNMALGEMSLNRKPERLYEPIAYILSLGGKRLRPVLTLAACDLFSGKVESAMPVALGIEIFHNFTLLHDDIMDNADMRRGKETVHKKWNSNVAILSGDTMFALAYGKVCSTQHPELTRILETFTQSAIEVCEGQQYDMDFETLDRVSIPEYINMIRLKTAVLLGCSLKVGALLGNAIPEQAQLLYDFGVNAGLAFQLKDDYLDAFGNEDKFGKSIGGDIAANKKTYLYLKCLEQANADDKETLLKLYSDTKTAKSEKIKEVLGLYEKYNIRGELRVEMEKYFNNSLENLRKIDASKEKKEALSAYAEWLYKRDY